MNVGGWKSGVKQWWGGSDGKLYAGGGNVILDENGIAIRSVWGDEWVSSDSIKFQDIGNTEFVMAKMWAFKSFGLSPTNILRIETETDNATYGTSISLFAHKTVGGSTDDASVTITSKRGTIPSLISLLANDILLKGNVEIDGGLNVGGTTDPGDNNLVVQGTIKDGSGIAYLKSTEKAADSDKLDGLDSTAFGRPVFLASPLTSTAWDGDAFSTTAKTKIDLSVVFGVPAGVKAVLVNVALRDSGSAANECLISLSPSSSAGGMTARCSGIANDKFVNACLTVPCDTNGDIWYEIAASGTNTMYVYLQIWGYWR
jgi:hypothetical protein